MTSTNRKHQNRSISVSVDTNRLYSVYMYCVRHVSTLPQYLHQTVVTTEFFDKDAHPNKEWTLFFMLNLKKKCQRLFFHPAADLQYLGVCAVVFRKLLKKKVRHPPPK